jgi:hypothetical protein
MPQSPWPGSAGRCRGRTGRTVTVALFTTALLAIATPCRADGTRGGAKNVGVDTEDIFGFVEGSDIGDKGEREVESDAIIRAGRSTGSFADTATEFQYK